MPTTTPARLGLRQSPNRQHRQCRTRLSASPVGFLLVLSKPSLNSFLSDVRAVGTVSVAAASERVFPILMMRVPARPRRARAPLHCPSTRRRSAMCPGCEPLPRLRRPPPRWRTGGLLCKHAGSGQRDRMPVQEIWRDFATAQPRILGALLDARQAMDARAPRSSTGRASWLCGKLRKIARSAKSGRAYCSLETASSGRGRLANPASSHARTKSKSLQSQDYKRT